MNALFKVTRYPVDFSGFAGKALSPKGNLVGMKHASVPENYSGGGRGSGQRRGGNRQ